jgi:hypothetical protein
VTAPELRRHYKRWERRLERELLRAKPRLFEALEEFANIPSEKTGELLIHFRKRWPDFFPAAEYDNANGLSKFSILAYPHWLHQIWVGGETEPHLNIMLGLAEAPVQGTPENAWVSDLTSIPANFYIDWDEGVFRYRGSCDFQKALYLLFQESWRARICDKCAAKFIASRPAQKYCDTDCSARMQTQLKQKWWAEHGEAWRTKRRESQSKKGGGKSGINKTR